MADSKSTFQVGDIVQQKSGGPKMTVSGDGNTANYLWCIWFGKDDEEMGQEFDPSALVKA